jgi:hypothetical protein
VLYIIIGLLVHFCTPDDGHNDARNMLMLITSINLNLSASSWLFIFLFINQDARSNEIKITINILFSVARILYI